MEIKQGSALGFKPPEGEADEGRWRVMLGNIKNDEHIGWVDKYGFYLRPDLEDLFLLSPTQLVGIAQQVEIIRAETVTIVR